jgi:hypothetical protein
MEIEVKVTATTEVAVDVTMTPIDGRLPGPPGAPRYRFVYSDDLVVERIDDKKPGNFRSLPRIGSQARIQDSRQPSEWPTRTMSSFPRAACFFNTRARSCSTL